MPFPKHLPLLALTSLALAACGKDGKIVTSLKDSPKTAGELVVQPIRIRPPEEILNPEDFEKKCQEKKGVIEQQVCLVRSLQAEFNPASGDRQAIAPSLSPDSFVTSSGKDENGAVLVLLDNKRFLSIGSRREVTPADQGELVFYRNGASSEPLHVTVSVWDCYDSAMRKIECLEPMLRAFH